MVRENKREEETKKVLDGWRHRILEFKPRPSSLITAFVIRHSQIEMILFIHLIQTRRAITVEEWNIMYH
jgi:hypothetical protein